ncbi:MAG: type I secretion system permease/ATPase, partial [Pseudomonadota bacterium]
LKNNQACIIEKFNKDGSADVIGFNDNWQTTNLAAKQLQQQYAGYILEINYRHFTEPEAQPGKQWFWSALTEHKRLYVNLFIATFITNIFVLVIPLFIKNVYDRVLPNAATVTLWALAIGVTIFFIFDFIVRMIRNYLIERLGSQADQVLANRLMRQLLSLSFNSKPARTGNFISNFKQYTNLRDFFTSASLIAFVDLPFIFLFLFFIWWIGGPIVWIPLIAVILILFISLLLATPARKQTDKYIAGSINKENVLIDAIAGLASIKSLMVESYMQKQWQESALATQKALEASRFYTAISLNITTLLQQFTTVGVVIYGVYLILGGALSLGGLVAVLILTGRALLVSQIATLFTHLGRSQIALERLTSIMKLGTDRRPGKHYLHRPNLNGDIEIKKLTFHYASQRVNALEDINLTIKQGEKVGIIGRIGAGKSTLLKLIAGYYIPSSGMLRIDGTDNNEIEPSDLRKNVHYLAHENTLFAGTLHENLQLANPQADDEKILRIAQITGVDQIVQQHPLGMNLRVSEKGENLSAGQIKAIALAQMILAEPNIYLLDDPCAYFDNGLEQTFIKHFRQVIQDKTLILVSHRASTLNLVDRIILMELGHIVADGPKEEILSLLKQSQTNASKESHEAKDKVKKD